MLFESCIDSAASAAAAVSGGAGRLELCESLVEGGVTPSHGKIVAVMRAAAGVPVHVLVRPRPGDFVYSEDEFAAMIADIDHCKLLGVAGIVSGALLPDGCVDTARTGRLIEAARPLSFTFHRAIDVTPDVLTAFRACLALGVDYVLTSGGAASALEGARTIRACVELSREAAAGGHAAAVVIAAGGIGSAATATAVATASEAPQLHGTARRLVAGASQFRRDPPVYMGGEKANSPEAEYGLRVADTAAVRAIVDALAQYHSGEGSGSGSSEEGRAADGRADGRTDATA